MDNTFKIIFLVWQMMLDHFGDAYRAYMRQTGRVIPKLGK